MRCEMPVFGRVPMRRRPMRVEAIFFNRFNEI